MKFTNLLIITLCSFLLPAAATAAPVGHVWNNVNIKGAVDPITVSVENELHTSLVTGNFVYQHIDLGVSIKPLSFLTTGLYYRSIFENKDGQWKLEKQPHADVTISQSFGNLSLKLRTRLDLRIREGQRSAWRNRDKFSVSCGLGLVRPFVSEEPFLDKDGFLRNELSAGLSFAVVGHTVLDLYYLWQSNRATPTWTNIDAIGLAASFSF